MKKFKRILLGPVSYTHLDVYKRQECAACHSPEGWKPANVDHSKFAFHLDGQHATVACESCHINGVFKGTPQDLSLIHIFLPFWSKRNLLTSAPNQFKAKMTAVSSLSFPMASIIPRCV